MAPQLFGKNEPKGRHARHAAPAGAQPMQPGQTAHRAQAAKTAHPVQNTQVARNGVSAPNNQAASTGRTVHSARSAHSAQTSQNAQYAPARTHEPYAASSQLHPGQNTAHRASVSSGQIPVNDPRRIPRSQRTGAAQIPSKTMQNPSVRTAQQTRAISARTAQTYNPRDPRAAAAAAQSQTPRDPRAFANAPQSNIRDSRAAATAASDPRYPRTAAPANNPNNPTQRPAYPTNQPIPRQSKNPIAVGVQSDEEFDRVFGAQNPARTMQMKKPKSRAKKIALIVLAVILVLAIAGCAWALWFMHSMDSNLAMDSKSSQELSDVLVPAKANQPFYMLVLGSDSREGSGTSSKADEQGDNQRSDVMILTRIDPVNKVMTMLSIPRDTPTTLPDGSLGKINELYNQGGSAASVKAVSALTGAPISHVAEIHFSELAEIVDSLGGVEVTVDTPLSYKNALTGETISLDKGTQTINGEQAQIFARARHEYGTDQDEHRQNNVRELAAAILKKALDKPIYEIPQTALSLSEVVGTDLKSTDIASMGLSFAQSKNKMVVYSGTGPSKGDFNAQANGLWLCYENPEGWKKIMEVVDAGEDPAGIDVNDTAIIPTQ